MGNKHPTEGTVQIISKHNGSFLAQTDNHSITTTNNKEAQGCELWTIQNIPNDESKQRMGFNHIIHNKHPSKLLSCSENGQLRASEIEANDCCTLWKIIQQKDSNIFEIISFFGLWLSVDSNGCIKMLSKCELMNDDKQYWNLCYISQQEMHRKNEQNFTKIMDRNKENNEKMHNSQDEDQKAMEKKQIGMNESIESVLVSFAESLNLIRSDIDSLRNELEKMEKKQQINQRRIENKMDELLIRFENQIDAQAKEYVLQ